MSKTILSKALVEKVGLSKKDAEASVNTVLATIQEELVENGSLNVVGFGKWEVRERAARKGRNPQDGTEIDIPATKVPAFKAGKTLREAVK